MPRLWQTGGYARQTDWVGGHFGRQMPREAGTHGWSLPGSRSGPVVTAKPPEQGRMEKRPPTEALAAACTVPSDQRRGWFSDWYMKPLLVQRCPPLQVMPLDVRPADDVVMPGILAVLLQSWTTRAPSSRRSRPSSDGREIGLRDLCCLTHLGELLAADVRRRSSSCRRAGPLPAREPCLRLARRAGTRAVDSAPLGPRHGSGSPLAWPTPPTPAASFIACLPSSAGTLAGGYSSPTLGRLSAARLHSGSMASAVESYPGPDSLTGCLKRSPRARVRNAKRDHPPDANGGQCRR